MRYAHARRFRARGCLRGNFKYLSDEAQFSERRFFFFFFLQSSPMATPPSSTTVAPSSSAPSAPLFSTPVGGSVASTSSSSSSGVSVVPIDAVTARVVQSLISSPHLSQSLASALGIPASTSAPTLASFSAAPTIPLPISSVGSAPGKCCLFLSRFVAGRLGGLSFCLGAVVGGV